jgi:hypothetical protein
MHKHPFLATLQNGEISMARIGCSSFYICKLDHTILLLRVINVVLDFQIPSWMIYFYTRVGLTFII